MKSFLDQSPGYLINMTALLLKRELSALINKNKINVTTEQWAILNRLKENSELSQKELAKLTFKDNANITRILDKLEKKGFVVRQSDINDRRAWNVSITTKGQKVRDQIELLAKQALSKALKDINVAEVREFNNIASKIMKNLTD